MRCKLRAAGIVLMLAVSVVTFAEAGPFEDADTASNRGDHAAALQIIRPLAERGDANAQYTLAAMYESGHGVPINDAEATKWYRYAADQGHADAQGRLAAAYADGRGVPKSETEAAKWYRKAADRGNAFAQAELGTMYEAGLGVPANNAEAMRWYKRAAALGNAYAQGKLAKLTPFALPVPSRDEARRQVSSIAFSPPAASDNTPRSIWAFASKAAEYIPIGFKGWILIGVGLLAVWFIGAPRRATEAASARSDTPMGENTRQQFKQQHARDDQQQPRDRQEAATRHEDPNVRERECEQDNMRRRTVRRDYESADECESAPGNAQAQDWWKVLGTAPDANPETVKHAYRSKMKQYHPDRVSGLGSEFVRLAEQKTRELNAALEQAKRRALN